MKAFDSVEWSFLKATLDAFDLPPWLTLSIMACITSLRFSVSLNGELVGFFLAMRGLRQGDPLSPLLFVLVMEVFSCLLHRATANPLYKFHWRCSRLKLSHLCFADDIFLFAKVDSHSVSLMMETLNKFAG